MMLAKQLAWFLRNNQTPRQQGVGQTLLAAQPLASPQARARREICLMRQTLSYELRQGPGRRRLSLNIDERGLRVGAPAHVPQQQIEAFIREHGTWVLRRLTEYQQRQQQRTVLLQDGTELPFLGDNLTLRLDPQARQSRWQGSPLERATGQGVAGQLWLAVPSSADQAQLRRRVRVALQQQARLLFGARLEHFAPLMRLTPPSLALSSARTRWGSCSRRTGIRLNWRLIHLPLPLIDYVVVHELAHVIEMNHSARFWQVVAGVYPDWQLARRTLQQQGQALPLL